MACTWKWRHIHDEDFFAYRKVKNASGEEHLSVELLEKPQESNTYFQNSKLWEWCLYEHHRLSRCQSLYEHPGSAMRFGVVASKGEKMPGPAVWFEREYLPAEWRHLLRGFGNESSMDSGSHQECKICVLEERDRINCLPLADQLIKHELLAQRLGLHNRWCDIVGKVVTLINRLEDL